MQLPIHGSNPQYLYEALRMEMPAETLDFSANINPLGPPESIKSGWNGFFQHVLDYPDPHAAQLTHAIAEKEELPETMILAGNGGAEIIMLVANELAGKKVLIIQPAFSEYAEACRATGCTVDFFQLKAPEWKLELKELKPLLPRYDAVFLCTPNNPTGICFEEEDVLELIKACQRANCLTVLDEAFFDFSEAGSSYAPLILRFPHLLVMRSMTKMFAIPGLRLGYLLADPALVNRIKAQKPHWSVNAIAQEVGKLCLAEEEFVERTREFINRQKRVLFPFYKELGLMISESGVNFYLLEDPSRTLFPYLLKRGIIPRHTNNFPGLDGSWLRFAVKGDADNARLMEEVRQWRMQS